jgi:hypothetical protein
MHKTRNKKRAAPTNMPEILLLRELLVTGGDGGHGFKEHVQQHQQPATKTVSNMCKVYSTAYC